MFAFPVLYKRCWLFAIFLSALSSVEGATFSAKNPKGATTLHCDIDGSGKDQTVTITEDQVQITSAVSGGSTTYPIGPWNYVQTAELDGQPGLELLFTNFTTLNGIPQSSQAQVLCQRTGVVTAYNVGSPGSLQIAELDGQAGQEVLFAGMYTVNGIPQSTSATVVCQRTLSAKSYSVGASTSVQLADLDGQGGQEALFTGFYTVNGFPRSSSATVICQRTLSAQTYAVGAPISVQLADLDGQPGQEALFTGFYTTNGIPQSTSAAIVCQRTLSVNSYNVGASTSVQLVNMNGQSGVQAIFTGFYTVNGFLQTSYATVVDYRTLSSQTYNVGKSNAVTFDDLDGYPGQEALFSGLTTTNGIPQPSQAFVLNWRTNQFST